jgi:hypothetical protein
MASRCPVRPLRALTQPTAATEAKASRAIAKRARVKQALPFLTVDQPVDHRADGFEIRTEQRYRVRLARLGRRRSRSG